MLKLFITDLDGTLLEDDHNTVSEENRAAIGRLRRAGVRVAIATGRTYSIAAHVVAQIECDYVIISNGAAIIDLSCGKAIYHDGIDNATAMRIFSLLSGGDSVFSFFCDGQVYMEERLREPFCSVIGSDFFAKKLLAGMTLVPNLPAVIAGRSIEKIDVTCGSIAERGIILTKLQEMGPFTFSNSFGKNIELNAAGVTKGKALRHLCGSLGIDAAAVMAFGDGDNDIDMLNWAGLSYAMENAAPGIKAAAHNLAPPNTEAGVAKVVEAYLKGNTD